MVVWFHPWQIARTAMRAVLSGILAKYLDRRETQAAIPVVEVEGERGGDAGLPGHALKWDGDLLADKAGGAAEEVWIDYVADVGDGWDATYTTAMLVGQEALRVPGLDEALPRADMLVLGGDLVYPTPSRAAYRDRLRRPFEAALPELPEGERRPWLYAIPGNHDWYDGLTNFLRVFCQGSPIGAWATRQTRSYFAVKLPGNWSIWGCDIQLDTRIDPVQMAHFRMLAAKAAKASNDCARVLLCTAKPSWIEEKQSDRDAYHNYWYFVAQMEQRGVRIPVSVAGDLHHYARYVNDAGRRHKITAGGGGSYLQGTHDLPREIWPTTPADEEADSPEKDPYHDSGFAFPDRRKSRRLALGVLRFPLLPWNWGFCLLLGALYLSVFWGWGLARGDAGPSAIQGALSMGASGAPLRSGIAYWQELGVAAVTRPWVLLLPLFTLAAGGFLSRLANPGASPWTTWPWGLQHGLLHVSLAIVTGSAVSVLGVRLFGPEVAAWTPPQLLAAYGGLIAAGGLLGGVLLGAYFAASDRWLSWHTNEAFAAQGIPDYRCFLRMRIKRSGELTIYPIGVRWTPRQWRRKLDRIRGEPHFVPHGELPRLHLIEGPIVIP